MQLMRCAPALFLVGCLGTGCAELANSPAFQQILELGTVSGPLDERTVASGLQEALRVGAERAVESTSKPGGFGSNPLLRIVLPDELGRVASALRTVGLGAPVDRLEDTMNHAAERAAGEATGVLWSAVRGMTISDAFSILQGGQNAATAYFREHTESALRARFQPIVGEAMQTVGVYQSYKDLVARVQQVPLVSIPNLDLDAHVTDRTLDGLFSVLADEEERIREDPAARTTALLRRVFSSS